MDELIGITVGLALVTFGLAFWSAAFILVLVMLFVTVLIGLLALLSWIGRTAFEIWSERKARDSNPDSSEAAVPR